MATTVKDTVNTLLDKLHLSSSETRPGPAEPSLAQLQELREKYKKADQDHVFTFYDSLTAAERGRLFESLSGFDPQQINEIVKKALNPPPTSGKDVVVPEPLPASATASMLDTPEEKLRQWYSSGLELIANNQVAVVLMAGGQGTRLGSSAPKGCYNIDLPSGKSLFQLQAERIFRVQELARKKHHGNDATVVVPWYIMTSGPTRGPTEKFFEENDYFKLKKEDIMIFEQGVLPCVSNEGKILLESKSKVGRMIASVSSSALERRRSIRG